MQFKSYLELAKIRLTAMVLVTTAVGFILGSPGPFDYAALLLDDPGHGPGRRRGQHVQSAPGNPPRRPHAADPPPAAACGQVSPLAALVFALVTSAAGVGILNELVNPLTALLGLANIVIYALVYTPLEAADLAFHAGGGDLRRAAAGHGLDGGRGSISLGGAPAGHDPVPLADPPFPGPGLVLPRRLRPGRFSHAAADRSPGASDLPDDRALFAGPLAR